MGLEWESNFIGNLRSCKEQTKKASELALWIQKHFHGLFILKATQICIQEVSKITQRGSDRAGKQPQPGLPQPPGCQAAAPTSGCTSHSQLVFRLCPCQAGPKRHAACPSPGLGALCSLSCKCSSHSCSSSPLRSQFPREAFPDHAARSLPLISFWGSGNR